MITTVVKDCKVHGGDTGTVRLTVGEMLKYSGVSLDDRASSKANGDHTLTPPYNRLTGALLAVDMEITNFGQNSLIRSSKRDTWSTHNFVCIITISRKETWSSLGTD